jgi:hypothetical protein
MQCDCESSNSLSALVDLKRGTGKWVVDELPKNRFEICYNLRELNAQTIKGAINHMSLITDFRISPQIKNSHTH